LRFGSKLAGAMNWSACPLGICCAVITPLLASMLVIAQHGGGVCAGLCAAFAAYADHTMMAVNVRKKIRRIKSSDCLIRSKT
jgi:hypothetical protein